MIKGQGPLSTIMALMVDSRRTAGHCVGCLASAASHGLCAACRADLPRNRQACATCGLPLPGAAGGYVCGECQKSPPAFDHALIPWRYQYPVDTMIGRYKYRHQRQFARPLVHDFVRFAEQALAESAMPRPEVLVPAPMHPARRRRRGFNQAADIAEHLGRHLGIPVDHHLIARTRTVVPQSGLNRAQRQANLSGLFRVLKEPPASLALVDDVVTTGATARALASELQKAGAQSIGLWALARTPGQPI